MSGGLRVLMTLDAVGGVRRYALDLAHGLRGRGVESVLVGLGPPPQAPACEVAWIDQPLDWLVEDEAALDAIPATLTGLARTARADLLHLNVPSQAVGIDADLPVVVASHSCVPSWWHVVRGTQLPPSWAWQHRRNRLGFDRADAVLVPSRSHARTLERVYGPIDRLHVVHNAADPPVQPCTKQESVLAAGRWWDEGKNAAMLDRAARHVVWPVRMAGSLRGPNGQTIALDHATPLGELPAAELARMMRQSAIFVSPSLYEPFGLAVLEAAAERAALVLSDIPTFRELWQDAAIFVPADDAQGFAAAINRLAANPALRAELGARAARIASERHPQRQLEGVLAAYAAARQVQRAS